MGHNWIKYSNALDEKTWKCSNCHVYADRPTGYPKPSRAARVNAWIYSADDKAYRCEEIQIMSVQDA